MFQTILVGYDGSENALHAAESAARLAKLFGSHVILLNVFPYPYTLIPDGLFDQGEVALDAETVARLAREDLKVVEDVALPVFEKYGVACQIVQEIGAPIEKILHTARKHQVDLIVVGSRGLSGWQQLLLGSVASGVLQQHDFPVLVVRKQRVEFRSLLLATDGSANSVKATETAFEFADRLDVPLSALYVKDTRKHWLARRAEAPIDTGQLQKTLEEELERLRGDRDVLIHFRIREGNPAQEIVEFAAENDKDLIIVGSRGLDPVRSLFLGSTSRAVVHHAPCSVLVVPRGE
ncbi:universal stress protein UspA-like protein [Chthonomonas calidirosea]|uniref:universal stress protein n=1 Tax=Chthonomonas calidirosea TaxID=454171 RepID=UPI0006DD4E9A|nr:universal stress protein [Chthonomonas calidirosea]CEK18646.1 universal stress protein UspA-like protein [Chthonomonas calidirosea]